MNSYDLEIPIMKVEGNPWTIRNAIEGLQVFGGIGAGKSSSSGKTIARKYLEMGFGGLVLTVKPDEVDEWITYCKTTGRLDDLMIVRPDGDYSFNFIDYEINRPGLGNRHVENLVLVLKTVIKAGEKNKSSNDAFWDESLDMLLMNVIELCTMFQAELTIDDILSISQSLPKNEKDFADEKFKSNSFGEAFFAVRNRLKAMGSQVSVSDLRKFQSIDFYFWETLANLNEKTRSIIEHMLWGLLHRLSRDPVYSLFCSSTPNLQPEDCLDGKIIVLDLPVKLYDKVGRDAQILFKYVWQRAMERRNVKEDGGKPVFLWADEAQNFLHEYDITYQATARSSRVCTVYLTQNLPNYYAQLGGRQGEYQVKSFMGTLATKIFHSNADYDTNKYASDLFGQIYKAFPVKSKSMGKEMSVSESISWQKDHDVPPEMFTGLMTGGPNNNFLVEAYIHRQGTPWQSKNGLQNYIKTHFTQTPSRREEHPYSISN